MSNKDEASALQAISKAYIRTQLRESKATIFDPEAPANDFGICEVPALLAVGDANAEGFDLNICDEDYGRTITGKVRIAGLDNTVHAEFKLPGDSEWRLLPESFIVEVK